MQFATQHRHTKNIRLVILTCICGFHLPLLAADENVAELLRSRCIGCHNNVDREGGVSLMSYASLLEGSTDGPILDRDHPQNSRLFRVLSGKTELQMPPEGETPLSVQQRRQLQQWILNGAHLPAAVSMPRVPKVVPAPGPSPLLSSVHLSESDVCIGSIDSLQRINVESGTSVWRITPPLGRISRIVQSVDERILALACGTPGVAGYAATIDAQTGDILRRFGEHPDAVYAVAIHPDGTSVATAGYDRRILIHDLQSGQILQTLTGHNGSIFDVCFDPSGRVLCSASADGTVKVWNTESGERLDTLSQPQAEQFCVGVGPDGKHIYAAGADNRIRTWDLLSLESARINPLRSSTFGHEQTIICLRLSHDGELLATAAEDGSVRIWSTQPLTHLASLPIQRSLVTSLTFIGQNELLLTHIDGTWHRAPIQHTPSFTKPSARPMKHRKVPTADDSVLEAAEAENNNSPATAQSVTVPARITGKLDTANTDDYFQFAALAGQTLVLETFAAANKSPLDSVIKVLHPDGRPVLRTRLQAVRDSWFTFRGKDSSTSDDFRLFYWQEMELNDFLYADGEVVRLWHYPRGPDSGFRVYPGFGTRHTWFDTTAATHALQAPCYVVVPHAPDATITPNGLPVFPVYYRNDDDSMRERGSDSRLFFTAPSDGNWIVCVSDARRFHGDDYSYELSIRRPQPGFRITHNAKDVTVPATGGREIEFKATRIDGFGGPITITPKNVPSGFHTSGPVVIESNQLRAWSTIIAADTTVAQSIESDDRLSFNATAMVDGQLQELTLNSTEKLSLDTSDSLRVHIESDDGRRTSIEKPLELQIRPGETIRAIVQLDRNGTDGIVSFGKDDAGRNLPHGVFVDNIGLNGLLMPPGTTVREFFITAAPIVEPGRHPFFLKSNIDGITSPPVILEVLPTVGTEGGPTAAR